MTEELMRTLAKSHYVYGIFKTKKAKLPIYIGKGSGRRPADHLNRRKNSNVRLRHWLLKYDCRTAIARLMFTGSEESCYQREIDLVKKFGRLEDGGCLFNFSEGGRGGTTGVVSSRKGRTFAEIYGSYSKEVRDRYSQAAFNRIPQKKIEEAKTAIRLLCEGLTPEEVANRTGIGYKLVACIRSRDSFDWLATQRQRSVLDDLHGLYTKVPFAKIIRVAKLVRSGVQHKHVAKAEKLGVNTVKRIGRPLQRGGVKYYQALMKYNKEYRSAVGGSS